ncbi:MAG TPA: endo-1,4-beta-xylanase [Marinagarivorans sp.]
MTNPCITVEGNIAVNGGAEDGLSPWAAQGATAEQTSADAHCGDYSILVSERTAAWNAPLINLSNFVAGETYTFEVWVKMAPGEAIDTLTLTVNYTDDESNANYTGVGSAEASSDEWVKISGSYIHSPMGASSGVYAYVEAMGETSSYYVDDMVILGAEGDNSIIYPEPDPTATGGLAAGDDKFLGNIIAGAVPADFGSLWNQVTPENAGKWGAVESARDFMNWGDLDRAYAYAKVNGMPFKGHTLVWGSQEPAWIGELSNEEQLAEVEQWIQAYCERYDAPADNGFAHLIDVVNEPTNAPASFRDALGGAGETGWDWVIWSYEKAREYCPHATLLINDYNIINDAINGNNTNSTDYETMIGLLNERGLIDGIGFQTHAFSINGVESWNSITAAQIAAELDRFSVFGVPLYISELDIDDEGVNQCERYKALFPTMWEHPSIQGVTLWGYIEGQTWRNDERSGLITADGTEKAAMLWLRDYFNGNPTADCGADT